MNVEIVTETPIFLVSKSRYFVFAVREDKACIDSNYFFEKN